MGRTAGVILFFAIVLALTGLIHWYLWARLVRDPRLPGGWHLALTTALVALAASMPAAMVLRRAAPALSRVLAWPAFIWMGAMFLLLVVLLGIDLVRLGGWLVGRITSAAPLDPERRLFLARAAATGGIATVTGLVAVGVAEAVGTLAINRVEIPLARLSPTLDGLRLVQLTDVHVGPTIGREHIARMVEQVNTLSPDIVAITGDLVDGSVADLGHAVAPLGELRARHGVFFVTGNHEYFSGADQWIAELGRLGIRVLRNERLTLERDGASLDLAGVDDRSAARYGDGHGEDLARALDGRATDRPVVLLAHQPRTVLDAARWKVDLQISGHTHGGQIWPFGYLVRLQQRFLAGLARHQDTLLYVSRGSGYWGPPVRLGAPGEIAELVLRSTGGAHGKRHGTRGLNG